MTQTEMMANIRLISRIPARLCLAAATAILLSAGATAKTYFSSDFKNTMTGCVSTNANNTIPGAEYYSNGWTDEGWTIGNSGEQGLCAVCPTHNGQGLRHRSRLTTPTVHIESDRAFIRWKACSILPKFNEAYSIYAQPAGTSNMYTIYTTDKAPDRWVQLIRPLQQFAGQDMKFIIECNSTDKFMLAIDDLYIGEPDDDTFWFENTTATYAQHNSELPVTGTITNTGRTQHFQALLSVIDEQVIGRQDIASNTWNTGETIDLNLWIFNTGTQNKYSICGENANGTHTIIAEGTFTASKYPRTLLLDHVTDNLSNQAPRLNILVRKLRETYRDNLAVITTHANADPLADTKYLEAINFNHPLYMMLNRDPEFTGDTERMLRKGFTEETKTLITASDPILDIENRTYTVTLNVTSADKLNNTDDRYRIGYTFTTGIYRPDDELYVASNSALSTSNRYYYFLPEVIPPELNYFTDVNIGDPETAAGIPNTLPAQIPARTPVTYTVQSPIPDPADNLTETNLVAYLLDTADASRALNAISIPLVANPLGTTVIAADTQDTATTAVHLYPDRTLHITGVNPGTPVTVTIHTTDGRQIACIRTQADSTGTIVTDAPDNKGLVIATVHAPQSTQSHKLILK